MANAEGHVEVHLLTDEELLAALPASDLGSLCCPMPKPWFNCPATILAQISLWNPSD